MGMEGKDLGPIYYSLSQTYKDNGQYELALDYSLKEYEFSKNNPEEVRILEFFSKLFLRVCIFKLQILGLQIIAEYNRNNGIKTREL